MVQGRRLLSSHRRHELRRGVVRRIRGRMLHALHPKCDLQQHQAQQRKRPSLGRLLAQKRCRHRFHTRSAAGVVHQREDFLQGEPHASSRHRDVRTCCSSSPSRPHAALHAICAIDTLPCEVAARNSHHPRASPSQPSPPPPIVTPSGYVERSLVSNSGGGDGGGGFWLRADYSYDAIDGRNVGHGQQYAGFVDVCGTRCTASSSCNNFMFVLPNGNHWGGCWLKSDVVAASTPESIATTNTETIGYANRRTFYRVSIMPAYHPWPRRCPNTRAAHARAALLQRNAKQPTQHRRTPPHPNLTPTPPDPDPDRTAPHRSTAPHPTTPHHTALQTAHAPHRRTTHHTAHHRTPPHCTAPHRSPCHRTASPRTTLPLCPLSSLSSIGFPQLTSPVSLVSSGGTIATAVTSSTTSSVAATAGLATTASSVDAAAAVDATSSVRIHIRHVLG